MRFRYLAAGSLAVAIAAAYWTKPGYLTLDVPVAPNATRYFWWEDQRAELAYADSAGVLYVHRRVGNGYPEMQGWNTLDDVFAHFDKHLHAQGWLTVNAHTSDPMSPESRLLPAANHRHYLRPDDRHGSVTLAVWPVGSNVSGFNVVLTTSNESWLRRMSKRFD